MKVMFTRFARAAALVALAPFSFPLASGAATMPVCAASDPVVWVNTSTHVYHRKGDRYFGTTKHGEYACESKAVASGAHASGAHASGSGKSAMSSAVTPAPSDASDATDASPAPSKKHHHRSKASPAPDATP
jgi:hypothetical protein